jgi:uncharacterized membrane protein YdjX (TVP38/TMEM64 family)
MGYRTKTFAVIGIATVIVTALAFAPTPSPAVLRDWALTVGPSAAIVYFAVYSLAAVLPLPRTAFNLGAGLLLGPVLGITIAVLATAVSAGLSFGIARKWARGWAENQLRGSSARRVHERLSQGGIITVASLRVIPLMPFAPLSYCCGISSIKTTPYLLGSVLGSVPSTVAVVLLGDAMTGSTPPGLLVCYAIFTLVGVVGLTRMTRKNTVREGQSSETDLESLSTKAKPESSTPLETVSP